MNNGKDRDEDRLEKDLSRLASLYEKLPKDELSDSTQLNILRTARHRNVIQKIASLIRFNGILTTAVSSVAGIAIGVVFTTLLYNQLPEDHPNGPVLVQPVTLSSTRGKEIQKLSYVELEEKLEMLEETLVSKNLQIGKQLTKILLLTEQLDKSDQLIALRGKTPTPVKRSDETESLVMAVSSQTTSDQPLAVQNVGGNVSEKVVLLKKALASKELENETLLRQITLLDEQIEKSTRLIAIQDEALALAQQQVSQAKAPDSDGEVVADQVRIVPISLGDLKEQLALLEESLGLKALQNEELWRQIATLAEQLEKSAGVIVLKSGALARAEQQGVWEKSSDSLGSDPPVLMSGDAAMSRARQ